MALATETTRDRNATPSSVTRIPQRARSVRCIMRGSLPPPAPLAARRTPPKLGVAIGLFESGAGFATHTQLKPRFGGVFFRCQRLAEMRTGHLSATERAMAGCPSAAGDGEGPLEPLRRNVLPVLRRALCPGQAFHETGNRAADKSAVARCRLRTNSASHS